MEGLAAVFLTAMVCLFAGLLRSAKASSRVTEHQQDSLLKNDEHNPDGQQPPQSLTHLPPAS
jgi:hypothetical protein